MTCDYKTKEMVYCKKLVPEATLPTKNNEQDAGWDLYAVEHIVVPSLFKYVQRYVYSYFKTMLHKVVTLFEMRDYINSEYSEGSNITCTKVRTGIACELQPYTVGLIWDRSGMGSKLIKVFGGVIDCTYRGEILVCLANFSFSDYTIKAGDRIAQMVIQDVCKTKMVEVDELSETFRGKSGFGSSGT